MSIVSGVVVNRSMSKIETLGVTDDASEARSMGFSRMICHVSFTLGFHAIVVFGVGRGELVGAGPLSSPPSSSPPERPMVRPSPSPSARPRIMMAARPPRSSLRRRDQGRFVGVAVVVTGVLVDMMDGWRRFLITMAADKKNMTCWIEYFLSAERKAERVLQRELMLVELN